MADSFFINSEAMSPRPAPCSQSRTRSKFVRIWTALDQENSPSWNEQNEHLFHSSQSMPTRTIMMSLGVKLEIISTFLSRMEAALL